MTDDPETQRFKSTCCAHTAAAGIRRAGWREWSRPWREEGGFSAYLAPCQPDSQGITRLPGDSTAVSGCWTWVKRVFILLIREGIPGLSQCRTIRSQPHGYPQAADAQVAAGLGIPLLRRLDANAGADRAVGPVRAAGPQLFSINRGNLRPEGRCLSESQDTHRRCSRGGLFITGDPFRRFTGKFKVQDM